MLTPAEAVAGTALRIGDGNGIGQLVAEDLYMDLTGSLGDTVIRSFGWSLNMISDLVIQLYLRYQSVCGHGGCSSIPCVYV